MASKERNAKETVANVHDDVLQVVADEFGYVRMAQSDFVEFGERFLTAHKRETKAKDAKIAQLRECLREAIIEMCHDCPNCSAYPKYGCKDQACKCFPAKWRAALAKAAGEGVMK